MAKQEKNYMNPSFIYYFNNIWRPNVIYIIYTDISYIMCLCIYVYAYI